MARLILDIGNTRTKIAVMANNEVIEVHTVGHLNSDILQELCNLHNINKAIASVVGTSPDFDLILPEFLKPNFHLLSHRSRLPIRIDYATPQTLGTDRLAAVVGASTLAPDADLLVVDAGTCITTDFLSADGTYHGGSIAPGINMRLKALNTFTAALPLVEKKADNNGAPYRLTGNSTEASIQSGVFNGVIFEIQGFVNNYLNDHPALKLFLTGGDADFFAKRLFFPNFASPNLVYFGLNKILDMNV